MPAFCCVIGCGNREKKDNVKFFRIIPVTNFEHHDLDHLSLKRRPASFPAIRRQNFPKLMFLTYNTHSLYVTNLKMR